MRAGRLLLLLAVTAAAPASASVPVLVPPDLGPTAAEPPAAPPPRPARLVFADLPADARVEVDGLPVTPTEAGIEVEPGSHLVTVFVPARPPLEAFVDLEPGDSRTLRLGGGRTGPSPAVAGGLLGAGTVAAVTGALWWLLAEQSADAAAALAGRSDLPVETRDALLGELLDREHTRRGVALGAAVAGAVLLTAGGVAALLGKDAPPALVILPGPGGVSATLRVTF